jgi:glycosyltransferase involved in cell wall biosynthesis
LSDYVLYCNDGIADLSKWKKSKKIIYWYDAYSDWSVTPPDKKDWVHRLRYENILEADYIFAVSHLQVEIAKRMRPDRQDTVFYMPVGVNCNIFNPASVKTDVVYDRFNIPRDKTIVGYLGYLGVREGVVAGQPILDIAVDVVKQHDAHFLVVGFGEGLPIFKEKVISLGLEKDFTFTGYVDDELVPACVGVMDICIDTLEPGIHSEARSETKLKQYMAMGKACVATAIGENCVDLDKGNAGVLVSPESSDLLRGVLTLCEDKELCSVLGEKSRQRALELYDWSKLAAGMAKSLALY